MARPTDLTPKIQADIVARIKRGNYNEQAALASGVASSTFYLWMARGEKGEPGFSEFSEAVDAARAEAETEMVDLIRQAGNEDPKCLQWILERTRRDRFGRMVREDGQVKSLPQTIADLLAADAEEEERGASPRTDAPG